jgi:hypothetical protein
VRRIFMDPTLSVLVATDTTDTSTDGPIQTLPGTTAPGPNVGLIVGLTVGLVVGTVLITIIVLLVCRQNRLVRSRAMSLEMRQTDLKRLDSQLGPVVKL